MDPASVVKLIDGIPGFQSYFFSARCIEKKDMVERAGGKEGKDWSRLLFLVNQSFKIGVMKSGEGQEDIHRFLPETEFIKRKVFTQIHNCSSRGPVLRTFLRTSMKPCGLQPNADRPEILSVFSVNCCSEQATISVVYKVNLQ